MKNLISFVFISLLCLSSAAASEPKIWTIDTRAEILKGEARGVSIDETGTISLAPKLTEVYRTEQSYVWSSVADTSGNVYLGTGSDGKIFKIDSAGKGSLLYDSGELNVSALAVGRSGEIYAGTSPDGKVYRIDASGAATVFFEPKEKYIWSLAVFSDGSLAVGTGENGKIYRVRASGANPSTSLFADTSETHIISMEIDSRSVDPVRRDNLYAGTDSNGLVLRFSPDGKAFALLDSTLREIHDLAIGPDGSIYALALSESAAKTETTTTTTTTTATVETTAATEQPAKSRYDLTGAKSAVYRILPDGGSDVLWNSTSVAAFSIHAHQNINSGVLVGTSDKGRVYNVSNEGRETLVLQSNEGQISTLLISGQNIFATSSNQGNLYRFGAEEVGEGTYESSILDAKASADWGRIWWRARGNVVLQTRSGNTEKPNETWSDWSAVYSDPKGAQINSPKAKYLQWRAVLNQGPSKGSSVGTGASSPSLGSNITLNTNIALNEVNVSYLPRNIAPEILSIQILPTNVGLQANPSMQIDPNIENSGLDLSAFGLQNPQVPPRRIYQRGARSIQWTAEDRNGDRLEYDVYYREVGETGFKLLRENLRENFFTIDGSALSDGRYIFKITAKDSPSNPAAQALSGERLSEPIDVDNSPPAIVSTDAPQISGDNARVVFNVTDTASFLTRAEYSLNGGEWQTVYADDGISDGARERYTLNIPIRTAGENTIALRVFDANGNVGSTRVVVRK